MSGQPGRQKHGCKRGRRESKKTKKTRKAPRKGTERERKSPGKPRSSCALRRIPTLLLPAATSHCKHRPACTGAAVPASISPISPISSISVSEQLDFMREENEKHKVNQNNHRVVRRATRGHTSSGGSLRGVLNKPNVSYSFKLQQKWILLPAASR